MCNQNEWIVREAFLAYDRGDVTRMMDFVDPDVDARVQEVRRKDEQSPLALLEPNEQTVAMMLAQMAQR